MSNVRVAEMLAAGVKPEVALHDHLRHNIYPPVPDLTSVAHAAINAVVEGMSDAEFVLPSGEQSTAQAIVDGLHLQPFVEHARQA